MGLVKHAFDEYGLCFECDHFVETEHLMLIELTESEARATAIAIQEHRNHHREHGSEAIADEIDDLLDKFERQYRAQSTAYAQRA